MSQEINNKRVYFFDAMRAILIIFILITHVLQSFNPKATWLIYNTNDINIAPFLIDCFMLFTLQSFFIMSGYLAIMSIKKIGVNSFFDSRIKRILIPIIITALTFNSFQTYLLVEFGEIEFNLSTYILKGEWIYHLWFLIDLSIFFFLIYIGIRFNNPIIKFLTNKLNNYLTKIHLYIILLIFSFITLILIALFSLIPVYLNNPIINISSIFFYFPFFIFGVLIFVNKKLFNQFINVPIFTTTLTTIVFVYLAQYFEGSSIKKIEILSYYFFNTSSNFFASALCFTIFHKFFNKKSNLFSLLSNASYSIYLFHHAFVVLGGIILIKLNIGGYLGFFILLVFVSALSLFIHHYLISKVDFLAFLYNGKKLKKNFHV